MESVRCSARRGKRSGADLISIDDHAHLHDIRVREADHGPPKDVREDAEVTRVARVAVQPRARLEGLLRAATTRSAVARHTAVEGRAVVGEEATQRQAVDQSVMDGRA